MLRFCGRGVLCWVDGRLVGLVVVGGSGRMGIGMEGKSYSVVELYI